MTGPREWWGKFEGQLPSSTPPIQRIEMKKAFIAGMFATLETLYQIGEDELSEEAGGTFLTSYHKTLKSMVDEIVQEQVRIQ